jgi:HlyD family secretion protein
MRRARAPWGGFDVSAERRGKLSGLVKEVKTLVWDRHRWISRWAVTLVLLAVIYYTATAAVAWLTAPRIEMTMSPLQGAVAVAAEPAEVTEIVEKVTYTGSISPYQEITVFPRWEGWVQEFKLYEGDRVEQGQVIARLDRAEIGSVVAQASSMVVQAEGEVRQMNASLARAQVEVAKAAEERAQAEAGVEEARAGLLRARSGVEEARSGVKEAEAALEAARADLKGAFPAVAQAKADFDYLREEFKRDQILLTRGAIGQASFDQRNAQYLVAQERVAQAQARVAQMEAKVAAAESGLVSARARVETSHAVVRQAEANLRRAEAGVKRAMAHQEEVDKLVLQAEAALASARARVGQARDEYERRKVVLGYTSVEAPITGRVAKRHIYAGILVKPGMPIVDLQDLSRVRVQAKVAEQDLAKVRVGTEAVVTFPGLSESGNRVTARVSTVFPQLDPVTRTATIEVVVPNPGERIKPDMYAVVDLVLARNPKAVTIPRVAVERDQQGQPRVFVTDGVSAMPRAVKLGISSGDRVEVVDGVKDGEMVIYRGQRGLVDGQQVNIVAGL